MELSRQAWRTFEQALFQTTVYDALDRNLSGPYDYQELTILINKYNLDVSPHNSLTRAIDSKVAVFNAAKFGRFQQFKWLLEDLKFAPADVTNSEGENFLLVASKFCPEIRHNQRHLSSNPSERTEAARTEAVVAKIRILGHYGGGSVSCPERLLPSDHGGDFYEAMLRLSSSQGRVQIIDLMHKLGLPLPTTSRFCVHECDHPTAKRLLELKITYSEAIEALFKDHAPTAMDIVKKCVFECADGETLETLEEIALVCLESHPWDVQDVLETSRLCLLQWLVKEKRVIGPLSFRLLNGESLLHLAIRNRQALAVKWLCATYPALTHVRGGMEGQLPVHFALDESVFVEADALRANLWRYVFTTTTMHIDNVWELQDERGRSVVGYATQCVDEDIRAMALAR